MPFEGRKIKFKQALTQLKTILFKYEDTQGFLRYAEAEFDKGVLHNMRSQASGRCLGLAPIEVKGYCPDCHYLTGEFTNEGLKLSISRKRTQEEIQRNMVFLATFLQRKFRKL